MTVKIPYLPAKSQSAVATATVLGGVMRAFLEHLGSQQVRRVLDEVGITIINADVWYNQQLFVEIYKILEMLPGGVEDIVGIGASTIDSLDFPPTVKTVEDALNALPHMYVGIHQGVPEDEGWQIEKLSDRHFRVIFRSPYSDYAAFGYLYAIVRRFRPKTCNFAVKPIINGRGAPAIFELMWGMHCD